LVDENFEKVSDATPIAFLKRNNFKIILWDAKYCEQENACRKKKSVKHTLIVNDCFFESNLLYGVAWQNRKQDISLRMFISG